MIVFPLDRTLHSEYYHPIERGRKQELRKLQKIACALLWRIHESPFPLQEFRQEEDYLIVTCLSNPEILKTFFTFGRMLMSENFSRLALPRMRMHMARNIDET